MPRSHSTLPAWQALRSHRQQVRSLRVRNLFGADPRRFAQLSREEAELLLDFSRQRVQPETMALLIQLAHECELQSRIAALLGGESVNNTERRPALHTALRRAPDQPLLVSGRDVMLEVRKEREKVFAFVRGVQQ